MHHEAFQTSQTITLHLHARLKELFAANELKLHFNSGECFSHLLMQLQAMRPNSTSFLQLCMFAQEDEYVSLEQPISASARIDLIPPVSGG